MKADSPPITTAPGTNVAMPACAHAQGSKPVGIPFLRTASRLTKLPIAALATLSAVTGYLLYGRSINQGLASSSLGVLFMAMGACALNEVQDRDLDARMARTCRRPIPAGTVAPEAAAALGVLLITSGLIILWLQHSPLAAGIGLLAVAWYNGVYACLKRKQPFAAVPGALTGALPPVIGWTASGGNPLDPGSFVLAFFFFMWQVPHFWLLLFQHGDDYARAGLPSLTRVFSARQLANLSFMWMLVTFASSLLFPLYGLTSSPWIDLGLLVSGVLLAVRACHCLRSGSYSPAFRSLNLYGFFIMALLMADAML